MVPMIAAPEDLARVLEIVEQVKENLRRRHLSFREDVPIGTMIETPSAALMADQLAGMCAFFSIGTNDLTQYTHAVDRVNPLVSGYYPSSSPAVEKLIRMAVEAAAAHDIPVSVCGESAADPELALRYVSMGIRTLSMAAVSLLEVKAALIGQENP